MLVKAKFTIALVGLLSVSSLFTTEVANARPTASQVEAWLKAGAAAIGIGGTIYSGYNTYMKDGEVTRNLTDENNNILFSYTANCRDRSNVNRFWRHPNNGTVTAIIVKKFPNNTQNQRQAVLTLINKACAPY